MGKLTSEQRDALPASDFVFPTDRRYPIHDRSHAVDALARSAGKPEEAQVRAAVKKRYPQIKVKKTLRKMQAEQARLADPGVEITVPVWKDDAKQIVYGIALVPGVVDSQGDVVSAGEIEKAAHRFLTEYRKHDVQHSEVTAGSDGQPIAETVESFIAPEDMTIAEQRVLKGSWVLAVHVADPETWGRVQKDEIAGFSIGGSGERTPLAA